MALAGSYWFDADAQWLDESSLASLFCPPVWADIPAAEKEGVNMHFMAVIAACLLALTVSGTGTVFAKDTVTLEKELRRKTHAEIRSHLGREPDDVTSPTSLVYKGRYDDPNSHVTWTHTWVTFHN